MKKIQWTATLSLTGLLCLGLSEAVAADQKENVIFRHHFLGQEALRLETGGTRAREIGQLPETDALRADLIAKLALLPAKLANARLQASSAEVASWVSPLLEDLARAESVSEIVGPTNRAEGVLAVRLNNERAALWSTNLWQLTERASGHNPRSIQVAGYAGWEAALEQEGLVQVLRAKEWLIAAVGRQPLEAMARRLRIIDRESPAGGTAWFEIEADLAALGTWLPVFRSADWPKVALEVRGVQEDLRTTGRITFREPIPSTYEPWAIPTNAIVDPITSFTVGQGLAPLLKHWVGTAEELGLPKLPNQICMWGQGHQQRQAIMTLPVTNATNAIHRLANSVPKILTRELGKVPEGFLYFSNSANLVWRFLAPPAVPIMVPLQEGGREYLMASVIQVSAETNPPPPELFAQLGDRQDLVYYDWEITEDRALFAIQFYQLLSINNGLDLYPPTLAPQNWLLTVRKMLGNCVTEIKRTGPKELSLVRKSHLGLTGFELGTLVQWFSSPNFPLKFELAPESLEASAGVPSTPGGP